MTVGENVFLHDGLSLLFAREASILYIYGQSVLRSQETVGASFYGLGLQDSLVCCLHLYHHCYKCYLRDGKLLGVIVSGFVVVQGEQEIYHRQSWCTWLVQPSAGMF